ncbi:hypothetical protein [Haloarchaeobius sp. HRN-SO-5]|uniref:hypothetical protein n=1 Tax=Haloarchaeobius sp. HRN-SO-5 TaxID=3446118 RepID=UPI003EBF8827
MSVLDRVRAVKSDEDVSTPSYFGVKVMLLGTNFTVFSLFFGVNLLAYLGLAITVLGLIIE